MKTTHPAGPVLTVLSLAPREERRATVRVTDPATRLLIRVGAGADARIVLRIGGGAVLHETDVEIARNARCVLTCVVASSQDVTVTQGARIRQGGSLRWRQVTLGRAVQHRLRSVAGGAGARSAIDWICVATGEARQDIGAENVFDAARGGGDVRMRGIARDRARLRLAGSVTIGPGGAGTAAALSEEALLLDPTAAVDAVPALTVRNDDVQASHSAVVRRVTPEELFSFAARGIDAAAARTMLLEGFLGELLEEIEDADVREGLRREAARLSSTPSAPRAACRRTRGAASRRAALRRWLAG